MKKIQFEKILNIVARCLSIVLFVASCFRFYTKFAIDVKQILPYDEELIVIILRWVTLSAVGLNVINVWFGSKNTKLVGGLLGLATGILNLIYYDLNMIAYGKGSSIYTVEAGYACSPVRMIAFVVEQVLVILLSLYSLYQLFVKKEIKGLKFYWPILILVGCLLTFFNPYTLQDFNYFTDFFTKSSINTATALDFSTHHIVFLAINIILLISLFAILKKAPYESKRLALICMSLSSIYNFFYTGWYIEAIPFHLCNAATILLLVAFCFNLTGVFYFTVFANVLGTIFAMLMPNTSEVDYIWTYSNLRFWYNHIYALVLPLLGLTLNVFERPKMKSMLVAVGVFTGYFLVVVFANSYINATTNESVNYFFVYDDFYVEKIKDLPFSKISQGASDIYSKTAELKIHNDTLIFRPLYQLIVYIVFCILMFVIWYVYDAFFHIADSHFALHAKKVFMRQQEVDIKKLLNGRSIKEPLYEEAVGMIEIKNFTKVYSGSNKPSVENLNLTIHDGEVYGFLGHNGAGKSTTIKSLVGIQTITSGQMIVDGYDVAKQPVEAKLQIGYVSDNHAVYEKLTGREYINYIADLYMVSQMERDERIVKYTKMFKLEDAIDREIKSYSHGMKQKIVVIASLIHDPKVWILDEPLTGLDPTSAFQIKECMREHASRGNIVFFSSHVIEVVEKVCTRICIIGHGKLQCEYSLKELKQKGISLESLYLKYVSSEEKIR